MCIRDRIMQHALKDARARKRVAEKLKSLKRHIKHWASVSKHQAAPRLNGAMMCRSGRHRSVCMAFFLEWCLTDSGFNVFPIVHVNKDTWGNLCSSCTRCSSRPMFCHCGVVSEVRGGSPHGSGGGSPHLLEFIAAGTGSPPHLELRRQASWRVARRSGTLGA